MLAVTANGVSQLVRAFSSVLWPGVAVVALIVFRRPLAELLSRVRRGKIMGQEFELDILEEQAIAFAENPPVIEVEARQPTDGVAAAGRAQERDVAVEVLEEAARSPRLALMHLSAELEREARRLIAATGQLYELGNNQSLRQMAQLLERVASLPRGTLDVVGQFSQVRNRIVHGHDQAVSDDDILRAVDAGLTILKGLHAAPRERNFVQEPALDLYADAAATTVIPDVKGVLLRTTSPGGVVTSYRIFPTTRTHFRKGQEVAWEWNMDATVQWRDI